ncbi:MAG: rod shape-determining protein RodA [Gammaproteobacteria bacterium]
MNLMALINKEVWRRQQSITYKSTWQRFHLDPLLLMLVMVLLTVGLLLLYSAGGQDGEIIVRQGIRVGIAMMVMLICAQIPIQKYRLWIPRLYIGALLLLATVLVLGSVAKGAQRWLDFGILRFQPAEFMKLVLPMMLASYFSYRHLPPDWRSLLSAGLLIIIPGLLIMLQPDLGTALVVVLSGFCTLLFAGVSWRLFFGFFSLIIAALPVLWLTMHDYQRQRLFSFLRPESDPLGNGYHIIQSKIAIGSGGLTGKGWLNSTQSQLNFLPEDATDFIFAVLGEEFGLLGCVILITLFIMVSTRIFYIASQAQDTFTRLFASSFGFIFFLSVFINMGMVMGLLPVVGLPLPLISYGGTSMVILMAGFGMVMSIHTQRKFIHLH